MKANELMIGDWVFMDGIPHQLSDINLIAVWLSDEKRLNTMDFKPIPLTEEILKANGFIKQSNGNYYHYAEDSYRDFKLRKGFKIEINECLKEISYVHELQHALRLCGLNDLADNFKLN